MMTGVEVGRTVAVGLGVVVGAAVQVGSMRTRGVLVEISWVGDACRVGVEVAEGVQAVKDQENAEGNAEDAFHH